MTHDAPTIAERYQIATGSSQLRAKEGGTSDLDLLMAAGWARSLGTLLLRLEGEFAEVEADVRKTAADDRTAQALIFMHLRTLRQTKEELGKLAVSVATKIRFMQPDEAVYKLAGRCLVVWLDKNCPKCEGRGFLGGAGTPRIKCHPCCGTGKRAQSLPQSAEERRFVERLLATMDALRDAAEARIGALVKNCGR